MSAVSSCDSTVLWTYLTSLHDKRRVSQWIESLAVQNGDPSSAPQWPALTADAVNDNTQCSAYMRDHILHMLARYTKAQRRKLLSLNVDLESAISIQTYI